jgi:hypothetical protein
VLASDERLPRPLSSTNLSDNRLIAGYLDRPLLPENFSATGMLDPGIGQTIDDWRTFYDASTRLVDYLKYVGYNALSISVLADGSTIYPSKLLEPTPRYDTGVLATHGMDPERKDVLELLLRLFDREGLHLIPAIQFAAPLPQLEALRRRGAAQAMGIEWIGTEGTTWLEKNGSHEHGLAPYYNPLHPKVQDAMLAVVRELAGRYGHHPSFAGLTLQLTSHGYGQLAGPEWGMDDATVARFQRDTGLELPGTGPGRFASRETLLLGKHREAWLEWRADQLDALYRQMHEAVAAIQPRARLYLSTAVLFDHPSLQHRLRPGLPRKAKVLQTMFELGLAVDHYRDDNHIVLLRPEMMGSAHPLSERAVDLEINGAVDLDQRLATVAYPACLFFHRPQRYEVPSFDAQSPFGKDKTYTSLVAQPLPSGVSNRRRFVHGLATIDARAMFDGGYLLPMGQEDAVRPLIGTFRQLPSDGFRSIAHQQQPVTIRTLSRQSETWIYLVNDSPWSVDVTVPLTASRSCLMTVLGEAATAKPVARSAQGPQWKVSLEAYDLVAARFSEEGVLVGAVQVQLPGTVHETLDRRIRELGARAASLRDQASLVALENSGFELPEESGEIRGWEPLGTGRGTGVQIDTQTRQEGAQSVRIWSRRGEVSLRSAPFQVPSTGRLTVSFAMRAEDVLNQGAVRLVLEDPTHGRSLFAWIGGDQPGAPSLNKEWTKSPYRVQFDNLAVDQLHQARLRFDLVGAGNVWIDNVQLNSLHFSEDEQKEIRKIIQAASQNLDSGQLIDCLRLLDGYWPQFLIAHVRLMQNPIVQAPPRTPAADQPAEKPDEKPGFADRLKGLIPNFWWR